MKAKIVDVKDRLQSLRHFGIDAGVVNKYSGIDEVRLAFNLAAAKRGQNAVRLHQAHAGLGQANPISIPERELAANEIGIVKDCVEAGSLSICGILIARGPEERPAKTKVVF